MTDNENGVVIGATKRTFDILQYIQEQGAGTVADVAREFDLANSTVHGYFTTLEHIGYLQKDENGYRLSNRFLGLGESARMETTIFEYARDEIDRLAGSLGQHANLMIEENGELIILYKSKGENAVKLDTYPGVVLPIHATAAGKAILAHIDHQQREEIIDNIEFDSITEGTVDDRAELETELETIREQGYAIDDQERLENIRCVAAPILQEDTVVASISVSGPITRFQGSLFTDELPTQVQDAANVIEFNMKYD